MIGIVEDWKNGIMEGWNDGMNEEVRGKKSALRQELRDRGRRSEVRDQRPEVRSLKSEVGG